VDKHVTDDGTVLVRFELPAAVSADAVSVCGDFNGWVAHTHPLDRLRDGRFATEIPLPPGDRWRFRYLLDGDRWENDWAADDYVPNGFGDDDSVVDLTDTGSLPLLGVADPAAEGDSPAAGPDVAVSGPAAGDDRPGVRRPGLVRRAWGWLARSWRWLTRRRTPSGPATAAAGNAVEDAVVERELVGAAR